MTPVPLFLLGQLGHNNFFELIFVYSRLTFDKIFERNRVAFFAHMGYIVQIKRLCAFSTLGQCVMRLWHHGLHLETRLQLWRSSPEEQAAGRSVPLGGVDSGIWVFH